ncbi:amidase [Bosea sp. (in: a-proteobacteria)]|jgi:amidase|uniref:amidase n=1 Tax=Bosea sp. (in: a-proteobacteria) TaxID=1871050 RepID=UPI002DDD38DC|nr:amidase family protein [Bosea sp. (in: a-proteobacteria)]HEV2508421.1 amidase family protein [Bosea sp. (in: a-proteobacteria)]
MTQQELWRLDAYEVRSQLQAGSVSPVELVEAAAARIEAVEGALNALPTLSLKRALDHARTLMAKDRDKRGAAHLHGIPMVVKDLTAVAGVRHTDGSLVHKDRVAQRSDLLVERLEAHGAIVLGKSNTPEFGAGGNTVNAVFGATANPWDLSRTTGGSSGGSAAALATGQAWLATGNDMAGSIRIPSAFCGVVGLRPSPGRVAHGPLPLSFGMLNVDGPMARTVRDVAMMFDAMVGEHPEDPISLPAPTQPFMDAVDHPTMPARVAWSATLGLGPVDPDIRRVCEASLGHFSDAGARVDAASPDLTGAELCFRVLRNAQRAAARELLEQQSDRLSPEIVHYTRQGLAQTADQIAQAELLRADIYARVIRFFRDYDLLVTPTVMAPPFDLRVRHLMEVDGTRFDDFFSWLVLTYAITITACPAISVPCGFTTSGLPVGLQIVAPPRCEARLLSAAALFEQAAGLNRLLPIDPRGASSFDPRQQGRPE